MSPGSPGPPVHGDDMTLEWVSGISTAVTALAGIGATFFTARYSGKNNLRAIES
jgi:hypothetical protein